MIPKVLHYVWVGGPVPPLQQSFVQTWRATNPGYKLVLWNEENIDFSVPMLREAYNARKWAKVADITRLMAIAKFGGIYFDTDVRLFRTLDPVLSNKCFFGFQEKNRSREWVGNAAIGAEEHSGFICKALERLLSIKRPLFGWDNPTLYGPRLITQMLIENGLDHYDPSGVQVGDVFVYPTKVFYPYHWSEEFSHDKLTEQTLGAHIWAETPSWVETLHPLQRAVRSSRQRVRKLINLIS